MPLKLRLASLLFAGLMLAGCFSFTPKAGLEPEDALASPLDPSTIVAEGATKSVMDRGVRLVWQGPLAGTMTHKVTIPPEALTMRAKFVADNGPGNEAFTIRDPATGLERCFITSSLRGATGNQVVRTCTGVAALDTDGAHEATYDVQVVGCQAANAADSTCRDGPVPKYELILDFFPAIDGPASVIDLTALSPAVHKLAPQKTEYVKSSLDGIRLFVELNLPEGPGPWPTILISSPYNQPVRDAGGLTQGARVKDFVPRGYAVVSADVRGFANSEGCVEVWGPREQQDQVDLVEWIAKQPWSNGKVAMYGQSYVGTTPHEAAIKKAPHLVTIATVAGLTDPYFDWHYGGVPNGESTGSPAAYSVVTAGVPPRPDQFTDDPLGWLALARTTGCDMPFMVANANNPNAEYGDYYKQRNFSAMAYQINVPVLYTQGYIDGNVKVSQALDFFNAIKTPKLGIFGPWLHRHPPRGDFDLILHAWMDRWVQGRDTKVDAMPPAQAITNLDTLRLGAEWPPIAHNDSVFYLDGSQRALGAVKPAAKWEGQYQSHLGAQASGAILFESGALTERLYISGEPILAFAARLEAARNTHFAARLFDVDEKGAALQITFGMLNAGLRNSYERYQDVPEGDLRYNLPFLPTEYVVETGHKLRLTLGPANSAYSMTTPGRVTITTGQQDASALRLPTLGAPGDEVAPISVLGFEAFR